MAAKVKPTTPVTPLSQMPVPDLNKNLVVFNIIELSTLHSARTLTITYLSSVAKQPTMCA